MPTRFEFYEDQIARLEAMAKAITDQGGEVLTVHFPESKNSCYFRDGEGKNVAGPFTHPNNAFGWLDGFQIANKKARTKLHQTVRELTPPRSVVIRKTKTYLHAFVANNGGRLEQVKHKNFPAMSLAGAMEAVAELYGKERFELLIQDAE